MSKLAQQFVLLALISLVFSGSGQASSTSPQVERFDAWLRVLEEIMPAGADAEEVLDTVIDSDARVAAFHLQGLTKVYADKDEKFNDIRKDLKDLEDGIGTVDKYKSLLKAAKKSGAKKEKIEKLQGKLEKGKDDLVELLEENKWVVKSGSTRIEKLRDWLSGQSWGSYNQDKEQVLTTLGAQLGELNERKWDLSYLEDGNGLHELRRELRWFTIEVRGLNGLVRFANSNSCPISAYKDLPSSEIADSKYSKVPVGSMEQDPCLISQCVFLGFAKYINVLGELKDQAEKEINLGADDDRTPSKILVQAKEVLKEMQSTKLLSVMASELKACKK